MKTKKIVLSNDFHKTEVVKVFKITSNGKLWISEDQAKSAKKSLCGVDGCTCGDYAGCRPNMVTEITGGGAFLIER